MTDDQSKPVTEAEKFATDGDGDALAEPVNGSPGRAATLVKPEDSPAH